MKHNDFRMVKKIEFIENLWKEIYVKNLNLTVFQSYEWNLLNQKFIEQSLKYKIRERKIIYVIYKEKIIMPFELHHREKNIYLLGQSQCSDYLDFIYNDINSLDIMRCIEYIKHRFPEYQLILDRINEKSNLNDTLKQISNNNFQQKPCYYIPIPQDVDFYETLSKSAKQNFRTANNRLKKNNLNIEVSIVINECLSQKLVMELYKLYVSRQKSKYGNYQESNRYVFLKKLINRLLKSDNDIISEYSKSNNIFLSYLSINKKIVAFYEGIIHPNGSIYICRVAIDESYKWYSPGVILLVKTIEELKGKYKVYDLTRGDEFYKIQNGGILNYNFCYTF